MTKIKTDIPGFDELIEGGIPEKNITLLTGGPGTGKTIFSTQFLVNGALKGDAGLYVTLEENKEMMVRQSKQFGWDLEKLESKNKLKISTPETQDLEELLNGLKDDIEEIKAKRFVLDSLPMLSMYSKRYTKFKRVLKSKQEDVEKTGRIKLPPTGEELTRSDLIFIIKQIKEFGTTSFLITEVGDESEYLSRDTVSEFLCDGVVVFHHVAIGGMEDYTLQVRKMRLSNISIKGLVPFQIDEKGITIKPDESRTTLGL